MSMQILACSFYVQINNNIDISTANRRKYTKYIIAEPWKLNKGFTHFLNPSIIIIE